MRAVAAFGTLLFAAAAFAGAPETGLQGGSVSGDAFISGGAVPPVGNCVNPSGSCIYIEDVGVGTTTVWSAANGEAYSSGHNEYGVTTGDNSPTNSGLIRENQVAPGTLTCTAASDSFEIKDLNNDLDAYAFTKCVSGTNVGRADLVQGNQQLAGSVTVEPRVAGTYKDDVAGALCLGPSSSGNCHDSPQGISTGDGTVEILGLSCWARAVTNIAAADTFTATVQTRAISAVVTCDECWTDTAVVATYTGTGAGAPVGNTFEYSGAPVTVASVSRIRVIIEEGTDDATDQGAQTISCTLKYAF